MTQNEIVTLICGFGVSTIIAHIYISLKLAAQKYTRLEKILPRSKYQSWPLSRFAPNTNSRNPPQLNPTRHVVYEYGNKNFAIFATDSSSQDWETHYCFLHKKISMNTEISIIISTAGNFSEKLFKRERPFGDESKVITYYRSYTSTVNDALEDALFQILFDLQKTKLNKQFDFEIYKGTEISLIFREFPKHLQDLVDREIIFEKLVATLQAYGT